MAPQRRIVHFSGTVQGVGFRFATRRVASNFAVKGYVRNLPDGRVLLVAEGDARELDAFIAELRANLEDYISSDESSQERATGEFSAFEIEY